MTYDRILTSNLMDYILLPELLRYSMLKIWIYIII
jgi:hypothetical protein